jgi:hypothetical protein
MNRDWRSGRVELCAGYHLVDADGQDQSTVDGVEFALEGGFVNVRVPGVEHVQLVSAPAVARIVCYTAE